MNLPPSLIDCNRSSAYEQTSTHRLECNSKLVNDRDIALEPPIVDSQKDSRKPAPQERTLSSATIEQSGSPILDASTSIVQPLIVTSSNRGDSMTFPGSLARHVAMIGNHEWNLPHQEHIVPKCIGPHIEMLKVVTSSSLLHTYVNAERQIFHLLTSGCQNPPYEPQVSPYIDPQSRTNAYTDDLGNMYIKTKFMISFEDIERLRKGGILSQVTSPRKPQEGLASNVLGPHLANVVPQTTTPMSLPRSPKSATTRSPKNAIQKELPSQEYMVVDKYQMTPKNANDNNLCL